MANMQIFYIKEAFMKKASLYLPKLMLIFFLIIYCIIAYFNLQSTIRDFREELLSQSILIERNILNSITNANQIIYGVASSLGKYKEGYNDKEIYKLVQNFDPRADNLRGIYFSSLVIVDNEYKSIASSVVPEHNFVSKDFKSAKCLVGTMGAPYKLKVGKTSIGIDSGERIVPLGMSFFWKHREGEGAICTGLVISELEKEQFVRTHYRLINSINIVDYSLGEESLSTQVDLYSQINIKNLISIFFNREPLSFTRKLPIYDFLIVINVSVTELMRMLSIELLDTLLYVILAFSMFAGFMLYIKSRYGRHISNMVDNLVSVPEELERSIGISDEKDSLKEPDIAHISQYFSKTIQWLNDNYRNHQARLECDSKKEANKKLLYLLALDKQHSKDGDNIDNHASLMRRLLYSIATDKPMQKELGSFLDEVVTYNAEMHNLELMITECTHRNKSFEFSYISLFECMNEICRFIDTSSIFNEESIVTIKGHFTTSSFPIISITAELKKYNHTKLKIADEFPMHPYMPLHTIYILAQKNDLALNITQSGHFIEFSLDPLERTL
jgi:hypothetical protein